MPDAELGKIRASGPKGRLLKGDVLAFIGAIKDKDYAWNLSADISKRGKLDLSNVQATAIKPQPPPSPSPAEPSAKPAPAPAQIPTQVHLSQRISLARLHSGPVTAKPSLETLISRASDIANKELPISQAHAKRLAKENLFAEILGSSSSTTTTAAKKPTSSSGSYVPKIVSGPAAPAATVRKADILDILSGRAPATTPARSSPPAAAASAGKEDVRVFSVTVPPGDEKRGEAYLARLKDVLETGPATATANTTETAI